MLVIIGLMVAGIGLGWLFRHRRMSWLPHIITVLIWILLFLLGLEVGNNRQLLKSFSSLGIEAMVLALSATAGSVLAAWGLWYILYKRKKG